MKILKVLLLPIIVYAAVQSNVIAQTLPPFECETDFNEDLSGPINHADGRHITAHDTLRILVVFAKFADDTNSEPSYWPDDGFPSFATNTGPEAFIDGTATQNSNHLINMTNYFREMSMGKFIVLGDVETVTAPKSADQYTSRHEANRDILQSLDANVNYSNYDNWTRDSLYTHTKNPDGKVDMIAMIWRDFHSHLLNFDGEASLQSGPDLQVDNGNTIIGFSFGTGSGFNVQTRTNVVRRLFQDTVHEMAHWLVGGPHPYSGGPIHRVWSMLQGSFISAASANTYEREKLGWIDVIKITQPMQNQPIGDFITTGNAFKYKVPNGDPEEFIYIENRQKESIYDDATHNSDDKGIFILHQRGSYSNSHNIRHVSSDGNWYWDHVEPFFASDPCCGEQPVFAKGEPNPINGQNYGTKITGGGKNDWLWGYKDENEFVSVAANYQGLPFIGAWNNQNRLLFAPNTNPMPRTWS